MGVSAIDARSVEGFEGPAMAISVPPEILQEFARNYSPVRLVSVVFRNITMLLSNSLNSPT